LNAIFGDEPKGDEACYDSSLIEKMSKLSNYVFELRSEISLKETQLLSLKEQIEEKNGKLKSLYILDCPLGFEQAQKIKQTSNSLKKKNMGLLKELEEVKSRSKII
jgi:hypothetical protein